MATVLISLVGEQPMPIIIAAQQLRQEHEDLRVVLVETKEMRDVAVTIKRLLEERYSIPCDRHRPPVPAFDLKKVRQACETIANDAGNGRVIFNVTGGTKTMSNAAYEVARAHTDATALYVETEGNRLIYLCHPSRAAGDSEGLRIKVAIEDYLLAHNARIKAAGSRQPDTSPKGYKVPREWQDAARELSRTAAADCRALDLLRYRLWKGKEVAGTCTYEWDRASVTKYVKDQHWPADSVDRLDDLIDRLKSPNARLLEDVQRVDDRIRVQFTPRQREFLGGDWLEWYVFEEAKRSGRFDDVRWGLEMAGLEEWKVLSPEEHEEPRENELDVVAVRGAVLTYASCKSGQMKDSSDPRESSGKQAVYELETVARTIGSHCRRLLVLSREPGRGRGGISPAVIKRCLILGIAPVIARDLPHVAEYMANPDWLIREWKERRLRSEIARIG